MATRIQQRKRSRRRYCAALAEQLEPRTLLSGDISITGNPVPIAYYSSYAATDFSTWHDGSLWTSHNNTITKRTLDGQVTTFTVPPTSTSSRNVTSNIVFTQDQTAWFVIQENNSSRLEALTASGTFIDESPVQTKHIWQLTVGADDSLWFTQGDNILGHMVNGNISRTTLSQVNGFAGITTASDGSIWFTADSATSSSGLAGHITPAGDISFTSFADLPSNPVQGADGNIYFGSIDAIHRFSPAGGDTRISMPGITAVGLRAAADGSIWFIDRRDTLSPLARLAPDGTVSHQAPAGAAGAHIDSLALGPDGALWTLDSNGISVRNEINSGLIGHGTQISAPAYKQAWDFIVGSINDTNLGNPADYSVIVDWGDGQTSAATLVQNSSGGYDILGNHAFVQWTWLVLNIHVADLRDPTRTTDFHSVVYVVPPGMAGSGLLITPKSGETFSGPVATYAGIDQNAFDQYDVIIQWGDGETSTGQLVAGANGETSVVGTHVYLHMGAQAISVLVTQKTTSLPGSWTATNILPSYPVFYSTNADFTFIGFGGITNVLSEAAMSRAEVSQGPMDAPSYDNSWSDEMFITVPIAQFNYSGTADDLTHFHAHIDTGDGRTLEDTTITGTTTGFQVTAPLLYMNTGRYKVIVSITDDRLGNAIVGMSRYYFNISSHLYMHNIFFTANSGDQSTGNVAFFTSGGSENWSDSYIATINWGDGTTSTGTVSSAGNDLYYVTGTHTFASRPYTFDTSITVYITETRTSLDPSLPSPDHTVTIVSNGNGRLFASPVTTPTVHHLNNFPVKVIAGTSAEIGLAGIALPPGTDPSSITGTITWSDGQSTSVRVEPATYHDNGFGNGWTYVLTTNVTFSAAGTYHGVMTLTWGDESQQFDYYQQVNATPTTNPWPVPTPPPPAIGDLYSPGLNANMDQPFTTIVAHFNVNPNLPFDPANAAITIHWGDGTQSSGTLQAAGGGYDILGTHTYESLANHSQVLYMGVTISTDAGSTYVNFKNYLTPDLTHIDLEPVATIDYRQRETFTATLAQFTAAWIGGDSSLADYSATINWGDGSTSTGIITRGYNGAFEIAGTHKYLFDGAQNYTVSVTGPGGPATITGSINLLHNSVIITPLSDVTMADDGTLSGNLAHFIDLDPVPANSTVLYVAMIDWGDGNVLQGTITAAADGGYTVSGSHQYTIDGDYALRLIVRRNVRDLPGLTTESIYDFSSRDSWGYFSIDGAVFSGTSAYGNSASPAVALGYHAQLEIDSQGNLGTFHISHKINPSPDPTFPGDQPPSPDPAGASFEADNSRTFSLPAPGEVAVASAELSFLRATATTNPDTASDASVAPTFSDWVSPELPAELPAPNEQLRQAPDDPGIFAGEFYVARYAAAEQTSPAPAPVPPEELPDDQISRAKLAAPGSAAISTALIAASSGPERATFLVVSPDGMKPQSDAGMLSSRQWWSAQFLASSVVALHFQRRRRRRGGLALMDDRR